MKFQFFSKKGFALFSSIIFIVMVSMSLQAPINGDEFWQADYGIKSLSYYKTFGEDKSSLQMKENMSYYGTFFDLTATTIDNLLGLHDQYDENYHVVRHIMCAMIGFIALLFAGLLAKELKNWTAAIITITLLFLSPRFLGDSMVNPKDIPFAASYIMSLYFMIRVFRSIPKVSWKIATGLILAIGFSINTRAGGLLNIAYLFFFGSLFYLQRNNLKTAFKFGSIFNYFKIIILISLLGYILAVIFWPFALQNPFLNPVKALTEATNRSVNINVLFEGEHMKSDKIPWYYLLKWIAMTVPLIVYAGAIISLLLIVKLYKEQNKIELSLLIFSATFPVIYAIMKDSSLYDGWRHFVFIYPPLIVFISLGITKLLELQKKKSVRTALLAVFVIGLAEPAIGITKLYPYQYTYFNPVWGGEKKVYGNYETDYWMLSIKEASKWLIANGLDNNNPDTLRVMTNCTYPVKCYFSKHKDKARIEYSRYYERSSKDWDYAIFYTRFVNTKQLKNKTWPPAKVVYMVEANGIPLCAVIKRENRDDLNGFRALNQRQYQDALSYFSKALAYDSKNETVWMGMAEVYLNTVDLPKAEECLYKALSLYPDYVPALINLGIININKKEYNRAVILLNKVLKIDEMQPSAYYWRAQAHIKSNSLNYAIDDLNMAVNLDNSLRGTAYKQIAALYKSLGKNDLAAEYEKASK